VTAQKGLTLEAELHRQDERVELILKAPAGPKVMLHWGLKRPRAESWTLPPPQVWPPGTVAAKQGALETPLTQTNEQAGLVIRLQPAEEYSALEFVLFFPDEGRWDNNGGRNYQIALSEAGLRPIEVLRGKAGSERLAFDRAFDLPGGGQLAAGVSIADGVYRLRLVADGCENLLLHWGICLRSPHEWLLPPESVRGQNASVRDNQSVDTPFTSASGLSTLQLEFPESEAPLGIQFVLREGANGRWINYRGGNFYVPIKVRAPGSAPAEATEHPEVAAEIVRAETTHNSWTLMHRFNLCYDLLERVRGSVDGLALVYVYLRFSAIRQLTWQRNYNTKPRELAHAQDRLTQKLTEIYRTQPESRALTRLALGTIGRGGEGQRIRDEILNIMHRHHIKEVSGHFLEEWHQKLHNNTTPDDVVICQAYLAFLQSNGNHQSFYQALEAGGVTRQRLKSFERPIRSQPDFVPHLKDALLHEFGNFLKILKASHSGTDLETAINAARPHVDGGMHGLLLYLWENRNAPPERLLDLVRQITDARKRLSGLTGQSGGLRELLYLDLALEQLLRAAVERNIHLSLGGDSLVELVGLVFENVMLSYEEPELAACSRHWARLQSLPRFNAIWALHAKSVLDRGARALGAWIDRFYHLLQPKAELLGHGFQAESWAITLFSEEVVRGGSLGFVLSILLRHLDPVLRQAAHIGNWQIISRGQGAGLLEVVDALRSIQGKSFDSPRVVVADRVTGEEEIPEGVTAVIAPDVVDIVSHVAVRARNAHVLFATCHDPEVFQRLKSLRGRPVRLEVSAAGDVTAVEGAPETVTKSTSAHRSQLSAAPRSFTKYAVAFSEFTELTVGSKALHQFKLRSCLPDSVHQPASAAIPFGVFEKVLSLEVNRDLATQYGELVRQTSTRGTEVLEALQKTVLFLRAPEELKTALKQAMANSGLAWPNDWEAAWSRVKQVWASKWNERAFLSRQRVGLPHESLFMSVLIQQVVPAEYAFVIHTVNPSSGNPEELFAEVVLGLGETLVGNYPGRALSFRFNKKTGDPELLSFPSKSLGLYGEGLIFRSDSNGEDLPGYAGAGLYDSVLLQAPRQVELDYTQQPIVWDERFRRNLLTAVARIGLAIERTLGSPQDIEGAVTGNDYYVVQTRPQVGLDANE